MRTLTILCVDDERNVLITLRAQLQRHFPDCTIEIAESGEEALELVEELLAEGVDVPLVIADQIMPGMKGDQFLIELHRRHPQILKVMLTGQATAENVGNVVNQGNLYRFLSKPWNETDLQLTVQEALRRYQQDRQIAQQQIALEQANQQLEAFNASLEQQVQDRTQQLWQSQQQLELFVEHVPAAVAMLDREMRYLATSRRWKLDYGLDKQSLVGRSHYDVFPDIPERWKVILQRCLAGAVERCEEDCFERADGSVIWNQWEVRPWYTSAGKIGGLMMLTQVITARKQAEEVLRQSEARLLNAKRVAHLGIWEFDLATEKITWSEELFHMLGLDPAQEEPSYEMYQQRVHPEDRPILQAAIHQAITQGTAYEVEHRIYHSDGSTRYMLSRGEAVRNSEGQIIKLMGTGLDQTRRKLAELALRESEAWNQAVVSVMPDMIIVVDASGHYLNFSFNQFAGDVIPVEPTAVGLHVSQVLPAEVASNWLIAIQQALATSSIQTIEQQFVFEDRIQYEEVRFVPYQADRVLCMVRNVTERKQAELALQESEFRLRRLSENLPGVVYRYVQYADGGDAFLYISPQCEAVYGIAPDVILQNASAVWSVVHPDDLAMLQSEIALTVENPVRTFYVEHRIITAAGEVKWIQATSRPEPQPNGDLIWDGVVIDITARKQAETALQESQQFIERIASSSPNVIYIYDLTLQRSVYVNKEVCTFLGYNEEELEELADYSIADLMHPDDLEQAMRHFQRLATLPDGEVVEFEYRMRHKNGDWRWFCSRDTIFKRNADGHVVQISGNAQDITARKQAETQLQRREAQLTAIASNVPGGVFRIVRHSQHSYTTLFASEGYRTLCGIDPEQFKVNPDRFINLMHPDDRERHFATWEAALQSLETFYSESRYILPTGETKWIATRAQFQRQSNGDVIIDGLDIDVTDRKQLELELSQREAFLNSIYNGLAVAISVIDAEPDGTFRFVDFNPACDTLTGIDVQTLRGKTLDDLAPDMDSASLEMSRRYYQQCVATGETIQYEVGASAPAHEGWWLSRLSPLRDETGRVHRIVNTSILITERKRAEAQLEAQNSLLSRIARGEPLAEILHAIVTQLEQQLPGSMGSVLLLDETDRLRYGAAPSLPSAYNQATDGVQIGDGVGSCGTAAYLKQTVISSDIATDPNWASYKTFALGHGLRACWSTPIVAADGRVLGTFGVYYAEARSPQGNELNIIAQVANIAGIAIERDLAEAKIRRSEEQLQLTLDFAGIGAWSWHPTTGEYVWNDKMTDLLELPLNLDNMFQSWHDRIHPDDVAQVEANLQTALETQQPFAAEYRYQLQDGRFVWRWVKGQGIYSASGEVERVLGVLQDITERKQAEEALRLSEAKHRALINALPDLIMRINGDGIFLDFIAPNTFDAIGQTGDFVGTHVLDSLLPDLAQRRMNAIQMALQTGELQIYEQEILVHGIRQTEECRVSVCADNEVLVIVRDISERKQAELALQESEARFRQLAETVREGFFVGDPFSLQFIYVNPAYEQITGFSASELYARGDCWLEYMHPDDRAIFDAVFSEGQRQIVDQEYRYTRPDNREEHWLRAQVFPIFGESGIPVRVVGTLEDITDRKRTEAALRDSEERRRLALDLTGTGSWEFQVSTGEAVWSDSHYRLMGLVPGERASNYQTWRERVHPEDLEWVEQAFAEALATHSLLDIEYRVVYPNGTVRWVLTKGQGIYSAEGQAIRMLGVMVDVTDRKLVEQALQQLNDQLELRVHQRTQDLLGSQLQLQAKEQFLRGIFEGTETPIFVFDVLADGSFRYVGWNHAAEVMTGVGSADALNKSPQELFGEETGNRLADSYRRCYEAGKAIRYEEHVWYGEQEIWVITALNPLRDEAGRIYRIVGSTLDILELKQTEQALQRSGQDLRTIFNNVYDALFIHAPDGTLLDVNDRAVELFGGTREQLLASTIADLSGPNAPLASLPELLQRVQAGETIQFEWQSLRLGGDSTFNSEVSLRPVTLNNQPVFIANIRDITERKQAEEALQQSEQDLRTIFNNVYDCIYIHDLDGTILDVNDRTLELHRATREQMLASSIADLSPPGTPLDRLPAIFERVQSGENVRFEWTCQRLGDWSIFESEVTLRMATLANRSVCIATVQDISDRKQAELALRDSEERFRQLAESVNGVFWLTDLQPKILYVSPAFERIWQRPAEGVFASYDTFLATIHPDDHAHTTREMAQRFERNVDVEYRILRPSGEVRWIRDRTFHIYDEAGELYRLAGLAEDITEQKQTQMALHEARQFAQSIADKTPAMLYIYDMAEQCNRYSNRSLTEMLGYTTEELLGMGPDVMPTILHPDDLKKLTQHHQALIVAEDGVDLELEYRVHHANGELRWFYSRDSVFKRDSEGNVIQYIGAAQDITDRKRLEHDLRQINTELEKRVVERTQDLQHAMEAAQAANHAKTTFLANMSHELRTPLNAILGFSQLLNRDNNLTLDQQEQVKIINRSGEHLLNLINDILAMSKIEAGRTLLTCTQFDLRELLQNLEELFRLKAEAKQLRLVMQISHQVPPLIQTDESKLRQVLINLLSNAIKFTSQGSVMLRVWSEHDTAPPALEAEEAQPLYLHFEVEDTGCGIDPTEQAIVFEPFGQTQSGRNSQEGTGLGLPISRQFVQLMGGDLHFTSVPHQGSTFYFTIPVEAVAVDDWLPDELADRVVGLAADQPSYRLLVVEDNLENRQFLVQLLSSVGFEVKTAINGQEAVELWHTWSPDLVWMDMRMPVMDGYAATQQIRRLEQQKTVQNGRHSTTSTATKILALTASAFEDERAAILMAGCDDFLFKPITEAVLFDKLAEHLGVRYCYETQVVLQTSGGQPTDTWLTSQELRRMPSEWIAELHYAARIADEDLILRVLDQLPPTEARLTDALKELVNALQIERLIELTQDVEDTL